MGNKFDDELERIQADQAPSAVLSALEDELKQSDSAVAAVSSVELTRLLCLFH
jgi:hypothetical protein